jgi:hypothetical protein
MKNVSIFLPIIPNTEKLETMNKSSVTEKTNSISKETQRNFGFISNLAKEMSTSPQSRQSALAGDSITIVKKGMAAPGKS